MLNSTGGWSACSETFRRLGRLDKTVDDEEVVTYFQGMNLSLRTKFTPSWEEELACNRNSFPNSDGSDFSKINVPAHDLAYAKNPGPAN